MQKLTALTVAGWVLLAPNANAQVGKTNTAAIQWSSYELAAPSGGHSSAELGTLEVPLIRGAKRPQRTTLRFIRLSATARPDGPPIIYLAGGPGSSGVDAAKGRRGAMFERLRAHGDVILLDQRGTGLSDPPPPCSHPWSFPVDPADERIVNESLEAAVAVCAAEWRRKGVDLNAYNTAENVEDVVALVHALGVPRVRLVGISYGTFLGLQLLRAHSSLVDSAVFAGIEGPDHTVKRPTQADHVLRELSARFKSAAVDGESFDLEQVMRRVFDRLAAEPVHVVRDDGSRQGVSLYAAQLVTTFLMATSQNAASLPDLFGAMDSGDFGPFVKTLDRLTRFYGALPAMALAMDGASPTSPKRLQEVARLSRTSLFGNAVNFPSADLTSALGIRQLPQRFTSPVRSPVRTLFISGTCDSRTPPDNAAEVRRGFLNSSHLTITGAGHDDDLFLFSPLIIDRIERFFTRIAVPDEVL